MLIFKRESLKLRVNVKIENGLLGVSMTMTNKYCILPTSSSIKEEKKLSKILKRCKMIKIQISLSSLPFSEFIGFFTVGNNHGLLVSNLITKSEFNSLCIQFPKDLPVILWDTNLNGISNYMVTNDKCTLLGHGIEKYFFKLRRIFKTKIAYIKKRGFFIANKWNVVLNNRCAIIQLSIKGLRYELLKYLEIPFYVYCSVSGQIGHHIIMNDFVCLYDSLRGSLFYRRNGIDVIKLKDI